MSLRARMTALITALVLLTAGTTIGLNAVDANPGIVVIAFVLIAAVTGVSISFVYTED